MRLLTCIFEFLMPENFPVQIFRAIAPIKVEIWAKT